LRSLTLGEGRKEKENREEHLFSIYKKGRRGGGKGEGVGVH